MFVAAADIEVGQARCQDKAAGLLGLSWDAAQTIMGWAVERGPERHEATPSHQFGIEEESFGEGHEYITVDTHIDGSRVLDVAPERTQTAAKAVRQTLTVELRRAVRVLAADIFSAYANAVAKQNPNAVLVHGNFDVAK